MTEVVLLTGGTGFVGRALVRHLLAQERSVRMIVRRPIEDPRVELFQIDDAVDTTLLAAAMSNVHSVCHIAGRAHITTSGRDAEAEARFMKVNVDFSVALAEAALSSQVRRFVYVSSISAVGTSSKPGQPLNHNSECHPVSPYGRSKLEAERRLRELAQRFNKELVIVRPPLVHGPSAPGSLARLTRLIDRGVPLPFGGVANQRSLIHVDNLAQSLRLCLDHPGAANAVFHVRDRTDYSTADIITGLAQSLGRSPRLVRSPQRLLKLAARVVGRPELARQLFGWLQVDDGYARDVIGYRPKDLPFAVG